MRSPGAGAADEQLARDIARLLALAGEEALPEFEPAGQPPAPTAPAELSTNEQQAAASSDKDWMLVYPPTSQAPAVEAASSANATPAPRSQRMSGADGPTLLSSLAIVSAAIITAALATSSSVLLVPTSQNYRYDPPARGSKHGSLRPIGSDDEPILLALAQLASSPLHASDSHLAATRSGPAVAGKGAPAGPQPLAGAPAAPDTPSGHRRNGGGPRRPEHRGPSATGGGGGTVVADSVSTTVARVEAPADAPADAAAAPIAALTVAPAQSASVEIPAVAVATAVEASGPAVAAAIADDGVTGAGVAATAVATAVVAEPPPPHGTRGSHAAKAGAGAARGGKKNGASHSTEK